MLGSTLFAPPPALADLVEAIWDVDIPVSAQTTDMTCKVLPSVAPVMVVHYRAPIVSDRRRFENQPYKSVVTGVQSEAVTLRLTGDTGSVVVRFGSDGAARMFGAAMAAFTDANVDLADIIGVPALLRLQDRLASAGTPTARLAVMEDFLLARLGATGFDAQVSHALRILQRRPGTLITALARNLDISERHLARRFGKAVGISPKQYTRIARTEHVLAARWRGAAWTDIAAACRFADQAHMINDFRALTGSTPSALMGAIGQAVWRDANARLAMSGFYNTAIL